MHFLIVKNAYPEHNGASANNYPSKKANNTPNPKRWLITPTLIKGANNPHP